MRTPARPERISQPPTVARRASPSPREAPEEGAPQEYSRYFEERTDEAASRRQEWFAAAGRGAGRRALVAFIALVALVAGACSGNNPQPPGIVQVGWSWNPAIAGTEPLPVVWTSGASPQQLPVLPADGCTPSGSAQAVTNAGGAPIVAGISMGCSAGQPVMVPVTWQNGIATALPLAPGTTQGSALAVAWFDNHAYVGGATGVGFPLPAIWKDGLLKTPHPETLLPPWCDAGIVTSLVVTDKYAVAAGVVHTIGGTLPAYQAVVWVLDPDFTQLQGALLVPPDAMADGSIGGSVAMAFDGLKVYSAASVSSDGFDKPVFWLDDVPYAISGASFTTAPWGVPTGIALVDTTPYVTGFVRPGSIQQPPEPVVWTPSASMTLSTAGETIVGSGEGVAVYTMWAFVSGESLGTDPTNRVRSVSVPALWTNGARQDLPALVPPGGGPALSSPLHAWWTVPGTTPPETWPWPGGFGEVLARGPVSAAGSAVARAIVTIAP